MFEKYTEKARKVIFFARYEAGQFGASEIKSEHLLMGLIREDKDLINKFFNGSKNLLDLDFVYKEVEIRTNKSREHNTYNLELSPEVKRLLSCAKEEYEKSQSIYLGTEHLLLGLLRTEGVASEILRGQGLSFDSVRDRIEHSIKRTSDTNDKFGNIGIFRDFKLVQTQEIIVLLCFVISAASLFISYTNFRSVVGREDYQTLVVLFLLVISSLIAINYGIYLTIKAIKAMLRS